MSHHTIRVTYRQQPNQCLENTVFINPRIPLLEITSITPLIQITFPRPSTLEVQGKDDICVPAFSQQRKTFTR